MPRLAGDWFIDMFTSEAEKLIDLIRERKESRIQVSIPTHWWISGLPSSPYEKTVAAVDGGGGVQPLAFGWSIYVARAYGYVEGAEPERGLELRLFPVRDTRVLDALRTWLEYRVATSLASRLSNAVVLMDGSLWVGISLALGSLAKLASGNVDSVAAVYTALFSAYSLSELVRLVETARSRGVLVAFVSKDHGFRAYKEKVLLDLVAEKTPALRDLVDRALEWYPLALRDQLITARRLVPPELRPLYDAALDPSYRDPLFLADSIGTASQGYTWILNMPPSRRVGRILSRGVSLRTLVEKAVAKAETLLGEEPEVEELRALGARLPAELDRLPRVRLFYARLGSGDYPLLVEVPGSLGDYYSRGRLLEEPSTETEQLVAILARHYAGPEYYNIPLVAAHINATFTGMQLDQYMALLEQLANARGVPLRFARRRAMWGALRRKKRRRTVGW